MLSPRVMTQLRPSVAMTEADHSSQYYEIEVVDNYNYQERRGDAYRDDSNLSVCVEESESYELSLFY